jgi:hypothetical protein
LLAVVLQDQIRAQLPHAPEIGAGTVQVVPPAVRERIATPLAHAFNHTFWWAVALTAVGVLPGLVLAVKARIPPPARGTPVGAPTPASELPEPVAAGK